MSERQDANRPRAVVWDVGRVLYQWNLRFLFSKLIPDQAELEWFVGNVITEEWHFQSDEGRPLAEMIPELKARFPDHGPLIDAYHPRFLETLPAPVPGTHALVERLAARGVPQFALSNFGAEFWAMFRPTAPVFDHFHDCVISGEERCVKPHPRIYQVLEERSGFPTRDLLFIDDRADNIAAAVARGWHGHVFTDAAVLEAELERHGLLG
ncbi:HAD-IA family hydrolase [Alteraurantiacibacter buctensis]|uniref:HAD-IA family hydrolase n=1 Tax=Alteraurantiacibacter buctensis TaxID=1503981 RepID=A0A844Z392_9SPHN|nr:HAD-IA family hydrolase [Alteraurantiacibacter buctensis]MXO73441.1 HAD-IA family hydrolase [Alteraurantiacibacter buctensis]